MEGTVGSVEVPRAFGSHGPCGRFVDAVAVRISNREPRKARSGPRIERHANRGGEHAGTKRTHDAHVCRREALRERLELTQQDAASASIGAVLAAGTFDLPP